jgi:hypothetical protein
MAMRKEALSAVNFPAVRLPVEKTASIEVGTHQR